MTMGKFTVNIPATMTVESSQSLCYRTPLRYLIPEGPTIIFFTLPNIKSSFLLETFKKDRVEWNEDGHLTRDSCCLFTLRKDWLDEVTDSAQDSANISLFSTEEPLTPEQELAKMRAVQAECRMALARGGRASAAVEEVILTTVGGADSMILWEPGIRLLAP